MRRMRWLLCAFVVAGWAEGAAAADFPFLRGSNAYETRAPIRWDGFYFGGQAGIGIFGSDFTNATASVADMLRTGPINRPTASSLGSANTSASQFGGFVGYNVDWGDGAMIGVEANYSRSNIALTGTNAMNGTYLAADGSLATYTATGIADARLTDYGTFRLRGGWTAGNFMPYAMVGLAVGRADLTRSVTATFAPPSGSAVVFPAPYAPLNMSTTLTGQFVYGYSVGVGLDIALLDCFFVRGEYEYVQFVDFNSINMHVHAARVAAAYKF